MTLAQPDSTLTAIRLKVRRLTASPSEQSLTTDTIDQAINTFYQSDFPYAIKLDQMRSVYTFYTSPNIEKYPMNVNFNQGIRSPVYFEGIQGYFFKDRQEFYNMWPRWPTLSTQSPTTLTGVITNASQANPAIITATNTLIAGMQVTINDVVGMTQLNGNTYTVLSATAANFEIDVDSTLFTAYSSGGTYITASPVMSFNISSIPFLSKEVVIGGEDINGNPIKISDDGNGNLYVQNSNPQISVPIYTYNIPGMKNFNTANPGDNVPILIGTINYVSGEVDINFISAGITPAPSSLFNIWVSQYQPGRPYSLLFWNNELTIRPVPDKVYKVEVETYLTPVQFLETSDNPILNQWWQYIAIGTSMELLRERGDFDGVENLREGFMRQEALVLERQAVEEIGVRNSTIFSGSTPNQGWNQGWGWPY